MNDVVVGYGRERLSDSGQRGCNVHGVIGSLRKECHGLYFIRLLVKTPMNGSR